jgi:hypothetical protein
VVEPKTDEELRREILAAHDPMQLVNLIHAYYFDRDRADRTPREVLYLHLGMLSGVIVRQTQPK